MKKRTSHKMKIFYPEKFVYMTRLFEVALWLAFSSQAGG
jgi:hypothetical protein